MKRSNYRPVVWPPLDQVNGEVVFPSKARLVYVPTGKAYQELTPTQQSQLIIDKAWQAMRKRPIGPVTEDLLSGHQTTEGQTHNFNLTLGITTPSDFQAAFNLKYETEVRLSQDYLLNNHSNQVGPVALVEDEVDGTFALEDGGFEMTLDRLSGFTYEQRQSLCEVVDMIMQETVSFNTLPRL